MEENSQTSQQSDKGNTGRTSKLTPEMLLEIFQTGVVKLQKSGFRLSVTPMFENGQSWVEFRLYDVTIVDRRLKRVQRETVDPSTGNPGTH